MPPPSEAGPSKPIKRQVVMYDSSDDDDDERINPASRSQSPKARMSNGNSRPKTVTSVNGASSGTPIKKKRKLLGNVDSLEGRLKREKEADKLCETRKELPFYQGRRMILDEVLNNETTIILGETGCGKSTQLPQLLRRHTLALDHYKRSPRIAITQPRRLPAIALANRVAAEMGVRVGDEVGYTVRFEDVSSRKTGVRYLTEGVLMRELANSSDNAQETEGGLNLLLQYDVIVIDEAHERTLNTDFLCGALKKIQRIRKKLVQEGHSLDQPNGHIVGNGIVNGHHAKELKVTELKLVIMSATLDPSKFVRFFETGRPAMMVKGRMYDVSTRYVVEPVNDFIEAAAKQVMQIHTDKRAEGDILVFMPGSDEIETCAEVIRKASKELPESAMKIAVLPLYAQMPPSAQAKIFITPEKNTRRVVIATNIAETSITIPGVAFVIDTGYKKEKEYIYRTSGAIEHLKLKPVSKAAAWQRTGRAGRERSGECYRLFTKPAFDKLIEYDAPEIQRCNLSSAILQLVAMGQNPFDFEYIDDPGREAIMAAFQTLAGLEALSGPTELTSLGRQMLRYPLNPSYARILIASFEERCTSEIIDILSLMDNGSPIWIDRSSERDNITTAKSKFINRQGDHLTALNAFRAYMDIKENKSEPLIKWAGNNYINMKTVQAALKVREQLRDLVKREGKDEDISCGSEYERVGKCLLRGLFMNTAIIQSDGTYRQTAGTLTIKIHPSSVLMSKKVPAILYDELTITSAMYARNVSTFEQNWLQEIPWFRQK